MKNFVSVKELGKAFMIFGNKGNVWGNNAHIYQSVATTLQCQGSM